MDDPIARFARAINQFHLFLKQETHVRMMDGVKELQLFRLSLPPDVGVQDPFEKRQAANECQSSFTLRP